MRIDDRDPLAESSWHLVLVRVDRGASVKVMNNQQSVNSETTAETKLNDYEMRH
jgi:hypothetical protein